MLINIIVGLVFACIVLLAFKKAYTNAKNNKCSCGSSCSDKSKCKKK